MLMLRNLRMAQQRCLQRLGLFLVYVAVLWQVQPGFLDAALQVVDSDHGGIERYLQQRMGLGPAALRTLASRYLEPA